MEKKKNYSSTLNVMTLQMSKNECIRYGGHINIQVIYKISKLEIPKKAPILYTIHLVFKKGCFEAILDSM
jgi:hypothetical protein